MSKISYIQLLKEAISEYDAKTMDYKGPLSEPILTFGGEGELETHKDASSILERYYFNENKDKLVEQDEVGPENPLEFSDDEDAEDPNEIITGEESDDVDETMEDLEDEILDEADDMDKLEEDLELEDYDPADPDIVAKDEPLEDEKAAPMKNEMVELENTIIEKLIQEMENEVPREDEPGTEAGTDLAEPKEVDNTLNDDLDLLEAELDLEQDEEPESDEKDKEEKDLDIDKEIGEEPVKKENRRLGPINPGSDHELLDEAFALFEEEIQDVEDKDEKEEPKDEVEEDLELEDYDPEDPDIVAKDKPLDITEEDFDLMMEEDEVDGEEKDEDEDKKAEDEIKECLRK